MNINFPIRTMLISRNLPNKDLISEGIVVHSTANPGATAENHFKYFNKNDVQASAHAFIDWNEIINTVPWWRRAWHAGPTANSKYIGLELCEPKSFNPDKFLVVWAQAVWLTAFLLITEIGDMQVNPINVISHAYCTTNFKDTSHMDPIKYFEAYKKDMVKFRADVQLTVNEIKQNLKGKVTALTLRVRKAPDSKAPIKDLLLIGKNVTIYYTKDGWYNIGPGAWVSAEYIKLV